MSMDFFLKHLYNEQLSLETTQFMEGVRKTRTLFLQMSFAENARSEADQMTSPFQVFFNRWR